MGVGVNVALGVGVAVGVKVAVGVGVGVGEAAPPHVKVNCWPELTGGFCPPVVSQPYWVKQVASFFTPTTN